MRVLRLLGAGFLSSPDPDVLPMLDGSERDIPLEQSEIRDETSHYTRPLMLMLPRCKRANEADGHQQVVVEKKKK